MRADPEDFRRGRVEGAVARPRCSALFSPFLSKKGAHAPHAPGTASNYNHSLSQVSINPSCRRKNVVV